MQPVIRLKYKWIKQRRKDVLLFLEENYGIEKNTNSKASVEDDLGITGDDAYELIQKFEQAFIVDMSSLIFTEYFYTESETDIFTPGFVWLLLKSFLLPFAILILPFSWSACKEILLYNPFNSINPGKKQLTVGDLVTSSFTHKFSLQNEVVLKLI